MGIPTATHWLDALFGGLDLWALGLLHGLAEAAGPFFTPFFLAVSFVGESGIAMFALAAVLMLFRKTRKVGICMFVAVCLGALVTNVALKDLVARPRPFEGASGLYYGWWQSIGSPEESGFSFPSGHVTAAMAGMTVLFIYGDKRISWIGFLYVVLMGLSRTYLMAHYPSDVLAAVAVGAVGALAAYALVESLSAARRRRAQAFATPR